jgi:hypothetical protein
MDASAGFSHMNSPASKHPNPSEMIMKNLGNLLFMEHLVNNENYIVSFISGVMLLNSGIS